MRRQRSPMHMRPLVIAAFISCCCAAFTPPLAIRPRPPVPLRSPRLRGCAESPVTRRGDIEVLATPPLLPSPAVLSKLAGLARGSAVSETRLCGDDGELAEECLALCDDDGCELVARTSLLRTLKVGLYIALWFGLSTMYQIENKIRLNMLSLPWLQSAASLAVGSLFVTFLWATGIRKPPRLTREATRTYLPIAFCHSIGHIGAVVSAAFGAVSFTQIVKAAEPVFTCGLGVALLGSTVSLATALTLLPIVAGVALASVSELSFTWPAFGGGMLSNLAFASRNILSRASMDKPKGENMTPENLFGVLTIMSFLWALPFALAIDGPKAAAAWAAASAKFAPSAMIKATVATGLYFYTYNEVAMLALNNVSPVTHAVANTLKRVFILLACVFVFRTPMTALCTAGSAIAILGSTLYSFSKKRDLRLAKEAADRQAIYCVEDSDEDVESDGTALQAKRATQG